MKMGSQDIDGAKLKANSHRKRRCSPLLCGIILFCKVAMLPAAVPESELEAGAPYSQPLTTMAGQPRNDDTFRPILPIDISPEFISRNVFTKSGQYRVFQPAESESDLRLAVAMRRRNFKHPSDSPRQEESKTPGVAFKNYTAGSIDAELKGLEDLLVDYVEQFFSNGKYEPTPGLVLALQQNHSHPQSHGNRTARSLLEDTNVELNVPRAFESARLLFFSGLKKVMWPIYMGLQVLKSVLFAMFLPTIISSVSRLIGKGITSGSAGSVPLFIRPMEPPQELDFRDNSMSFDDDSKFSLADEGKTPAGYEYNAEASQQQAQYAQVNGNSVNQATLSRYGGQQMMQDTYLSALQSIGAASFKNSQSMSGSFSAGAAGGAPGMTRKPTPAVMNTFQSFQKVPSSSLLLSNYDPFYSPLLSRLDSVFAQLKLNPENEACREKLICLMYANPAKYAPYSNLVSAQLSRELNELRKPTSDNPDILRFFKYMRAAKDGQDGVDCDDSFAKCKELKDLENPAMLSTYNDINKLVQARKLA
ncbi:uncharacterized protein LOC6552950 [Drosophila erecta]|uniref:GG13130 n=1 Tax=Drosophila erecta TaxID=7220 RepID=B3NYL5_DROER|nr:uncharacterized protein LOC6552950 [Drosophila erecta]XP_026833610.1 uncharacterized protein LOC6552950 [Drosophila erecta]EDV47996.1 uncharacterized protein Dere_GG13130 [Drosophila erecta]